MQSTHDSERRLPPPRGRPPRVPSNPLSTGFFTANWKLIVLLTLAISLIGIIGLAYTMATEEEVRQIALEAAVAGPPRPPGPMGPSGPRGPQGETATQGEPNAATPASTALSRVSTPAASTPTITPAPTARPRLVIPATPSNLVEWVKDSIVRVQAGSSGGSGFIFETEGDTAFVVTNHHVIEGPDSDDVVVQNKTI